MPTPSNEATESVVARARNGDRAAFSILVDRYAAKALSLSVRLLKNHDDAEDALQDAFVRAYRALPSFRMDAAFSTWFYRIVYTTCLNALDRQRRRPAFDALPADEHLADDVGTFDEVAFAQRIDAVREALTTLPPLYGAILDLFYVQQCSHADIAAIMDLPVPTVKTRLHRGRALLREAVHQRINDIRAEEDSHHGHP